MVHEDIDIYQTVEWENVEHTFFLQGMDDLRKFFIYWALYEIWDILDLKIDFYV